MAMIQANELRVGSILNYYIDEENEWIPTTLDWQDIKWISEDPKGFNEVHKPVELTEEVLLDCRIKASVFKSNFSKDVGGFFVWVSGYKIYRQHLHQLQNLYISLTGEELEVKL